MKNIFFTSDTHFHHKNIVRGTTTWEVQEKGSNHGIQSLRDFDTLEEHDEALIKSINSIVKYDDVLYHLGDWSFGGLEQVKKFRDRLECREIHLIFGNHDEKIEDNKLDLSHSSCMGIQSLFSSTQYYKELDLKIDSMKSGKYGKTNIVLSHYSHQVWNKSHKGAIHLFGHSHGSLKGIGKSMDVGVDTNNLYPYHLDEILDIMKNIKTEIVDHHSSNTN